jgi:hypothetical protein
VLDADERQSLVSVRALGRAGVRVTQRAFPPRTAHGGAHSAGDCPRLATRTSSSTHCYHGPAVRPRALLEARDGTIEALRARRAEIEAEAALALPLEAALAVAVDKERKLALAEHLGVRVPISEPVRSGDDARLSGGRTGFPAVIKPVQSWVPSPGGGRRLSCVIAIDADEARIAAEQATRGRVVLQQWVRGSREAVSRDHPGADALAMTPNTPRPS